MFTCHQTSLSNGLQFIRYRKSRPISDSNLQVIHIYEGWVNSDTFPSGKIHITSGINPGQDAIIGQAVNGAIEKNDKVMTMSILDGETRITSSHSSPLLGPTADITSSSHLSSLFGYWRRSKILMDICERVCLSTLSEKKFRSWETCVAAIVTCISTPNLCFQMLNVSSLILWG